MKRLWMFCVLLWAAFAVTGILLHRACEGAPKNQLGWVDIAGYDSEAFLRNYARMEAMFETGHRHPLIGIALSPIIAVGATAADRFGTEAGCRAIIVCFAFVGAMSFMLLWLVLAKLDAPFVARVAAAFLWLSFAHVWILGGVAESFGLSMMILLGVLLLVAHGVTDARAWLAGCVVAGGVTVTNGVKPLLVWLFVADGWRSLRGVSRKTVRIFCGVCAGLVLAALAFLVLKWTFLDGFGFRDGVRRVVTDVEMYLPRGTGWDRRGWLAWNLFFCEPMMLHAKAVGALKVSAAYENLWPHVVGAAILALCTWSAIVNFRRPVVRAALTMVACDVFLHVLLGWGYAEGHIYCGHWFWIVPLLVGLLPGRAALGALPLAAFIVVHNLGIGFW